MGLNSESGFWFILGGEARLWLEEGRLPGVVPAAFADRRAEPFDHWQGRPCYLLDLGEGEPGEGFAPLRSLMEAGDEEAFRLAGRAWQLVNFRRSHRFCGHCGAPAVPADREWAMVCREGHTVYPRLSPCIIVAVRRGPEILLAAHRRHHQAVDPMYTVLAGFVEPGESLEQCVAREVFEESGIRITNIRYVASQPWPFPHSLMMGFLADYESGELTLQEEELVDADFFRAGALPRLPPHGTIARRLIALTLAAIEGEPS